MANNGERWDRIERGIEHLLQSVARHDVQIGQLEEVAEKTLASQKHLLTAQVLFVDETRKNFERVSLNIDRLAEAQRQTDERLRQTDERVNALVNTVDSIIRRMPLPPA
jgi:ABC-type transporter Mla subunit MlaD